MDDHISDETLERHAAGHKLPEAELAALEEHLLTCTACQDRLRHWEEYVAAMRQALKELNEEH
jgi:anti-sigma factor RsiW